MIGGHPRFWHNGGLPRILLARSARGLASGYFAVVLGVEVDGTLVGYAAGEIRRSFGRSPRAAWVDAFGVDLALLPAAASAALGAALRR